MIRAAFIPGTRLFISFRLGIVLLLLAGLAEVTLATPLLASAAPQGVSGDPTAPLFILQVAKLFASDSAVGDEFGWSTTLSGDTLVVGVPHDDDNGSASGSAYVFERNWGGPDNWGQVAKLTPSDGDAGDRFGWPVAMSGGTLVVGASGDSDNGAWSGSAYVFERDWGGANNWGEVTKLMPSDGATDDYFGLAIAIDGDTLVVGAYRDDDRGANSGSAYVFERDWGGTDNWGQVTKLTSSDGVANDRFGRAVAINKDTLAVGSFLNVGNGAHSGSAYVFGRNQGGADNWGQVTKLNPPDDVGAGLFGYTLAMSGDTLAVGAYSDGDGGVNSGAAYVFERNQGGTDNWGRVTKIVPSDGASNDQFGFAMDISRDTLIVGADSDDDNGPNSGSAFIFERDQGGADNWGLAAKLTPFDGASSDRFGGAVAISESTLVVGAYGDDDNGSNSGSAYAFHLSRPASLSIAKHVSTQAGLEQAIAAPGHAITYTLAFSCTGPALATGIVITDRLPIGMTDVASFYSGVLITATPGITFAWQVQDLAPGQSGIITITGQLSSTLPHGYVLTNTATITSTRVDTDTTDNSDAAVVVIDAMPPDVPTPLGPADGIVILNDTSLVLVWNVSPSPDVAGYLLNLDGAVQDVGNVTTYSTGPLSNGAHTWALAAYDELGNVSPYADDWEFTIDASANLGISKDVDKPTPGAGDAIVYTLAVINNSLTDATGIEVSDPLPAGVTYMTDDGNYDAVTGIWSVGGLNAGDSATLHITATVDEGTAGTAITNTATIIALDQNDPLADNDEAEAIITVTLLPTFALTVNTVGQGSASLNPAGGFYKAGTVVTLTATPAPDWKLVSWGDSLGAASVVAITMDSDKSITVTFEQAVFPLYLPVVVRTSRG